MVKFYDTLAASRRAFRYLPNHQLHTVAAECGYCLKNHHHALADAEATAELFLLIDRSFKTAEPGLIASWQHLFDDEGKRYGCRN